LKKNYKIKYYVHSGHDIKKYISLHVGYSHFIQNILSKVLINAQSIDL